MPLQSLTSESSVQNDDDLGQQYRCPSLFLAIFLAITAIALLFAWYTDHRWEDWYITYRASKNLAVGNGLVFTPGERVHSFTSPVGTVVPALISLVTGNSSDDLVMWVFRLLNAALLGITGCLLFRIASHLQLRKVTRFLLLAVFATHILIIDFSINGMETAFMMLCIASFFSLLLIPAAKLLLKLSLVFAAFMYTRPDGFIYAGAIALGFFLFHPQFHPSITSRIKFLKTFLSAGGIAVLFYLPWFFWVWSYYGTPVPHTIIAKGALTDYSLANIVLHFFKFPIECFTKSNTLNMMFMPPYAGFDDWGRLDYLSKLFCLAATFYFVFYPGRKEIKAISLAVFLMQFYLNKISGQGGMPWYLANVALPTILTLALLLDSLYNAEFLQKAKASVTALAGVLLLYNLAMFAAGAYELKQQQQIIEFGNRKQIGLWLKRNAAPDDNVFMECLGYIGFYSELKTYDFPGMSSPEVVAARKKLKSNKWELLINELRPDWLVLRPHEAIVVERDKPGLLSTLYEAVKLFDVSGNIPPKIPGKHYLMFDSRFTVYRLKEK